MYKVVYKFKDLSDDEHVYNVDDIFPREGHEVSFARIRELASDKNKIGKPLIEEVVEKEVEEPIIEDVEEVEPIEDEIIEPTPKKKKKKKKAE